MPTLTGFDHVHVNVKNRELAAEWYREVLGFEVVDSLRVWAQNNGPLTIADPSGRIHLALFAKDDFIPGTAVAFGANAIEFMRWKKHLEKHAALIRCTDHKLAWSLYFTDLDGNSHEITTYDYADVAEKM